MVITIIGGGASGMAAALAAAENPAVQVVLVERQARLGRKLQATGNGRCKLSNLHASRGGYHGGDDAVSKYAISRFSPEATLDWFRGMGLFTVAESSGRVYPYSDQANSVVDVLRFALEKPNITVKCGVEMEKVKKTTWRATEKRWTVTGSSSPAVVWQGPSWAVPCPAISCCGAWATTAPGCARRWCS